MNEEISKYKYVMGVNTIVDESISVCVDMNIRSRELQVISKYT